MFNSFTDLKLKKYFSAISDCQACLQIDPMNIKAHLRMAEAHNAEGKHLEVIILNTFIFLKAKPFRFSP